MDADPSIGLAGGYLNEPQPDGGFRRIPIPPHHVHGALKLYRRECFASIDGVQERLAWDTIDEVYARMRGFQTRTLVELVALHHRPVASADGILRGRARHGRCLYITHYPLPWVSLRALKTAGERPRLLSGAAFLAGYVWSALTRVQRVPDAEFRAFMRAELGGRARRALRLRPRPSGVPA
jgi:hypothetical protein